MPDAILEFVHVGNVIKVSAVDPATLTEVSIVGDPRMSQAHLARAALRKLAYVLGQQPPEPPALDGKRLDRKV